MKNETSECHPSIIEEFCGGAWYAPQEKDEPERVKIGLLSVYGAVLFAAVATALVAFLGGG